MTAATVTLAALAVIFVAYASAIAWVLDWADQRRRLAERKAS